MNNYNNYNPQYTAIETMIPPEYTPISMWGYFGYQLLFNIPVVGIILLIIFSISAKNVNLKNFARSYFCVTIIMLILLAVLIVSVGGIAGVTALLARLNA